MQHLSQPSIILSRIKNNIYFLIFRFNYLFDLMFSSKKVNLVLHFFQSQFGFDLRKLMQVGLNL